MQQATATEDLTSVEWRDTNWIERVGGFQNQQMVLDYFAMSPFWDRQCNNQILAMQTQYNDLRQPYEAMVEALRKMTGIEFAVIHEKPPVWVIQKRYRRGPVPDDVQPIATYYIMGANVYQSPTIYSVIANRLLTSLFHVNSAFKETQDAMDFYPSKGYSWKAITNKPKSTEQGPSNTGSGTLRARENQEFRHWMDRAIESSAVKVTQSRQAVENPESVLRKSSGKPELALSNAALQQREEVGAKRQGKKSDDGNINKRKKKSNSGNPIK